MTLVDGNVHSAFEKLMTEDQKQGSEQGLVAAIAHNGIRPPIAPDVPKSIKQLITSCWSGMPNKRPPIDEIVNILETKAKEDVRTSASVKKAAMEEKEKQLKDTRSSIIEEARFNMRNLHPSYEIVIVKATKFLATEKLISNEEVKETWYVSLARSEVTSCSNTRRGNHMAYSN